VGGGLWVVGVVCSMWYVGELHWSKGEVYVGAWCVKCEVCGRWWVVGGGWVVGVVCGMCGSYICRREGVCECVVCSVWCEV